MANGNDNVENIILEHLRHIRGRVDVMSEELRNVKLRLTNLEDSTATGLSAVVRNGANGFVGINRRLDGLDERVDRIERRLELSDA